MDINYTHLTNWPPLYTLKKSARARYVKLKASVRHGLELVVPLRFNQKHIPEILESNKSWIEKQLAKIREELQTSHLETLPNELILPALNQTWKLIYIKSNNKKVQLLTRPQRELVFLGNIENQSLCKKVLRLWVKDLAKTYLPTRLQDLSEKTQLPYKNIVIRGQRSRWGSCSTQKIINLNYKLLFLSSDLVDHIIIHELCHTIHMNHSAKFWRLVASFDTQWKQHSREVRRAEKHVPTWVDCDPLLLANLAQ